MKRLALSLTALLGVLIALLVIRTATFRSQQLHPPPAPELQLDQNAVMKRLSETVQFKTISIESVKEHSNTDPFRHFHAVLVKSFPRIHTQLTREVVNDHSLLYTWKGLDDKLKPILLMAHLDVVPVDPNTENSWTHGPFSGRVADSYVWGRGTIDNKASLLGMLEAVERLLADGFQPQRTVYLAFGHDEETGGQQGAAKIAALLGGRGAQIEFALDEGSGIINGIIPDVAAPVAMIGLGEKGYLTLELTVTSPGGHSSLPPKESAIGILSRAIARLKGRPSRVASTRRLKSFSISWHANSDGFGERAGRGTRVCGARARGGRFSSFGNQGRDTHPPQRLQTAEEAAGLRGRRRRRWLVIRIPYVGSADAKA